MRLGKVAVLMGGRSAEREISLMSGRGVLKALRAKGVDAHAFDPARRDLAELKRAKFSRCFVALHGRGGEDGTLQGALELLGIPYTGSGVLASALAMDKVRSKHLFGAVGVTTPDFEVIRVVDDARAAADRLGYPLVLKPASQGSSVGMSKVFEASELAAAAKLALGFGDPAIVERCITGDEITVAVLQGEALPSIRIVTPRIFYDYKAKYETDTTQYFCPGTDHVKLEKRYRDIAMRAFEALGCAGWGRVDLMAGSDGVLQVLEVNTVPGMTSHSLVPMAAKAAGIDFAELCWRILETSFARANVLPAMGVAANDA